MVAMEDINFTKLLVIIVLMMVGKITNAEEQTTTVVVHTPLGYIKGIKLRNKETKETVNEFRGIPYAEPPIGTLRFRKPVPVQKWKDTLDATSFGVGCPQTIPEGFEAFGPPKVSEDCLILNVYVPFELDFTSKKSVMVWIHGGGLATGYAHQYDGGWIATEGDVIVVTINYRLDILGFLALDHQASKGNYGLWDQKLALQWVHDNIAAFGGNPESVTIFGQSGGAWSVSYLSLIPSNRGLFQRSIAQSGVLSRTSMPTSNRIKDVAEELANKTACPLEDMFKFVDCLRDLPVSDLLKASDYFASLPKDKLVMEVKYAPVVDGDLYKEHPLLSLETSSSEVSQFFKSLDFMTGVMSNEGSIVAMVIPELQEFYNFNVTEGMPFKFLCEGIVLPFVNTYLRNNVEIKERICNFYRADSPDQQSMNVANIMADTMFIVPAYELLEFHTSSKGKAFQYVFSRTSDASIFPTPQWMKGAGHGAELPYMFDMDKIIPGFNISAPTGEDKELSRRLIQYWTSFAKTGNPDGGESSLPWRQYDKTERLYLDFDLQITEKSHLKSEAMTLWTKVLQEVNLQTNFGKIRDEL